MDIEIPERLIWQSSKRIFVEHYKASLTLHDPLCCFKFERCRWVVLPELVSLLNWSSKLTCSGKVVEWSFRDPRSPIEGIDDTRFRIRGILGNDIYRNMATKVDRVLHQAFAGRLYPSQWRKEFQDIKDAVPKLPSKDVLVVNNWLDVESQPLSALDVLAYMERYQIFQRAIEVNVTLMPDPRTLPKSRMSHTSDTACLELRPIQSLLDAQAIVDDLDDQNTLARILGEYVDLGVVRGGAFSKILVAELGRNIGEHSNASAGWICTRLVSDGNVATLSSDDPALISFQERGEGFLEIIVCDNGDGLTSGLGQVLLADKRESVRSKYGYLPADRMPLYHLVDYAFDRLSSSKRGLEQLLHLSSGEEQNERSRVVASGLYWVWSVVRSYQGVIAIRTGDVHGWYDFTSDLHALEFPAREVSRLDIDPSSPLRCGTMLQVCLPLKKKITGKRRIVQQPRSGLERQDSLSQPSTVRVVFLEDLARRTNLRHTRGKSSRLIESWQQDLPGIEVSHEIHILQELKDIHMPLKDGDILVLDLYATGSAWLTQMSLSLCHFFVEMNYTSTIGRSAVVLANVPQSCREMFERSIWLAMEACDHLKEFRRVAMLIWDD